jgi:Flp pilus assembly protein TadG
VSGAPASADGQSDRGQATVEAALVLPFVALLLLAVVQVGLLVRAQVLVTHAAREAARAAAVDPDPNAALDAAEHASSLDAARMKVSIEGRGDRGSHVTVHVTYDVPTDVPLIGALVGDIHLEGEATMRVE